MTSMMQIVYFSQKSQLWEDLENIPGEKLFVAPSPAKADSLRPQLRSSLAQDVLTIAKFTSELISLVWQDEEKPLIKRKSELLLIFGILKNKHFPQLGYEQFVQAYNLFSDLRSFTLSEEALISVLEEQAPEIRMAVETFWKLLSLTGYSDEHEAYHLVAEALRSAEEIEGLNKVFVFWGFQHLNGQQLDLLKALAIRYTVVIPFPLDLKEKLKRSDWLSWLSHDRAESRELISVPRKATGHWLKTNSRDLSYRLSSSISSQLQVVLGVPKLKPEHMDLVPSANVGFKIAHEFLSKEILELFDQLEEVRLKSLGEFESHLVSLRAVCLKSQKDEFPFKKLKVIQLFQDAIASIRELTEEEISFDHFFLKLLRDVVLLNQPRTSFAPFLDGNLIELKDMSSLEDIDRNKKIILCVDERFEDLQGMGQNYTESIQKHLSTLGPLKRNDLDLSFRQWELENLFADSDVTVLMPESVLKHNLIWKRMFSGIELNVVADPDLRAERRVLDPFKKLSHQQYTGSYSASRLQTYADCPRKFYYSYVEPLAPTLLLEKDIDQMVSGTLIHKIIEEFYLRKLSETDVPKLTKEIFDAYISENNLKLPEDVYGQRRLVFTHRSLNGIKFLQDLAVQLGGNVHWMIEKRFSKDSDFKFNGSMDCLAVTDHHIVLLDFKSSKAAASTNTEIETQESYQLWVYSLAAKKIVTDFSTKEVLLGYVVLDDPSESNLLCTDQDVVTRLKEHKIGKPKVFKDPFFTSLQNVEHKIDELIVRIENDSEFPPLPRKSSTCEFCELKQVCPRGGGYNV